MIINITDYHGRILDFAIESHSFALDQALVRAVDCRIMTIQILTPIHISVL